jgi:hypothetical protein
MLASPALSGIDALIMGAGAAAHAAIVAATAGSPPLEHKEAKEGNDALILPRPTTGKKRSECPLALLCRVCAGL